VGDYDYGLWILVVLNAAVILIFAASFFHPRTRRDWRAFGLFSGLWSRCSPRCTACR
jgi:hypothetical protein